MCVPGEYLVVSVILDAVLQRDVHSVPSAFTQPRVTEVSCT